MPKESKAVRVFTVALESRYVVVRNVPAIGVVDELLRRLSLFGTVCAFRVLNRATDRATDDFTDNVWVEYESVNNARHAKARAGRKPFYGSILQVEYAPQDETPQDTALKLAQRRELLLRRAQHRDRGGGRSERGEEAQHEQTIGPQLSPLLPPTQLRNDDAQSFKRRRV